MFPREQDLEATGSVLAWTTSSVGLETGDQPELRCTVPFPSERFLKGLLDLHHLVGPPELYLMLETPLDDPRLAVRVEQLGAAQHRVLVVEIWQEICFRIMIIGVNIIMMKRG